MSLPLPMAIKVMGDDWDPIESIKVSEIFDPFFPLKMTVWNDDDFFYIILKFSQGPLKFRCARALLEVKIFGYKEL